MTGSELVQLGAVLVKDAQVQGITLRLNGGVAIRACCPSIETHPALQRTYQDLDLVGALDSWNQLENFFAACGFSKQSESPAGLKFARQGVTVEVDHPGFREDFQFDLSSRLNLTPLTLPLADLLLVKLARIKFQEKDIQDCAALLADHRVTNGGDEEEDINREYLYPLVNREYRLWKTVFDNTVTLEKLFDKYLEPEEAQLAWRRTELLQEVLDGKSHSLSWWAGRVLTR